MEKYLDSSLSARERAEDLLKRMTLEEKVKQLASKLVSMPMGPFEDTIRFENGIGHVAAMGGKDTPLQHAEAIRKIQEKVIQSSRFGIPAIVHCEALSGPVFPGALTFPTSISLGATFDPEIVKDMGERIRRQLCAVGIRQALSPVFDIARDLRWGRSNETYGNDPVLVSEMGCAFVEGLQGEDLREGVAATAKHFLGYSSTEGGINMAKTMLTHQEMREVYAKPFEAAIRKAGLAGVMNSYAEWEGRPFCASRKMLTDLLRGKLGFEGVVVSDYMSIERLVEYFHVAENYEDAAVQCLRAGLDIELPDGTTYNENLIAAVEKGLIEEKYVDISCIRSLELKFKLGLFENPYPMTAEQIEEAFNNEEDEVKSLEAARKAMTLVKNEGILPIRDKSKKILVVGPTGNNLRKMWSTYTALSFEEMFYDSSASMAGVEEDDTGAIIFGNGDHPEVIEPLARKRYPQAKTIVEALKENYPNTQYLQGCDYKNPDVKEIEAVTEAAKKADVVIVTVGGKNGYGPGCTSGEGIDAASFELPGAQEELLEAVGEANSNFIVVHTDARPLVSAYAYEHALAILEGWYCCTYAGQVIAETISGKNNPGGRLQQDVPYADGIFSYHYQNNASHRKTHHNLGVNAYSDCKQVMARPFGYGLGYTTFEYSNIVMNVKEGKVPVIEISVDITNTGRCAGDEVVQLYGKDVKASMVRPYKELLGFQRIHLEVGESKKVTFHFGLDILSFENEEEQWVLEKGEYLFYVAENSDDETRKLQYFLKENLLVNETKRVFFASGSQKALSCEE